MKHKIIYETPNGYVINVDVGRYETYHNDGAAAVKTGTFHFPNDPEKAYSMAKTHAEERREKVGKIYRLI